MDVLTLVDGKSLVLHIITENNVVARAVNTSFKRYANKPWLQQKYSNIHVLKQYRISYINWLFYFAHRTDHM